MFIGGQSVARTNQRKLTQFTRRQQRPFMGFFLPDTFRKSKLAIVN
jgi:hypothetical protein